MPTRGVWPLLANLLLEYQRRSIRRDAVEFLLFRNEVHLGLLLHWERQLLLSRETIGSCWLYKLERILLTDRSHEAEALILVSRGHWHASIR